MPPTAAQSQTKWRRSGSWSSLLSQRGTHAIDCEVPQCNRQCKPLIYSQDEALSRSQKRHSKLLRQLLRKPLRNTTRTQNASVRPIQRPNLRQPGARSSFMCDRCWLQVATAAAAARRSLRPQAPPNRRVRPGPPARAAGPRKAAVVECGAPAQAKADKTKTVGRMGAT